MDIEVIDEYLTMNSSLEEEQLRRSLAIQGPSFIETMLYRALLKLRSYREGLDHLFAGRWAEMSARVVFDRAADLILEMVNTAPGGGDAVARQLVALMEHQDAGIRALGSVFSGLKGIPFALISEPLQKLLLNDEDLVVKMAAALMLQGSHDDPPMVSTEVQALARRFIAAYMRLARQEPGSMSFYDEDDLEEEDSQMASEDEDEEKEDDSEDDEQEYDRASVLALMNMMQVLQHMPQMIALQGGD